MMAMMQKTATMMANGSAMPSLSLTKDKDETMAMQWPVEITMTNSDNGNRAKYKAPEIN